jgi:hypothetical protein
MGTKLKRESYIMLNWGSQGFKALSAGLGARTPPRSCAPHHYSFISVLGRFCVMNAFPPLTNCRRVCCSIRRTAFLTAFQTDTET